MRAARLKSVPVVAITPSHRLTPGIAIGACRAGASGVLDLGIRRESPDIKAALAELTRAAGSAEHWGIRWDTLGEASKDLTRLAEIVGSLAPVPVLVLAGLTAEDATRVHEAAKRLGREVILEVHDLATARAAQAAGYDGLVVKGHESGGRVSPHSSFMLLQEFHGQLSIPYWIQGGVALHSAASAVLAGAAGVVLCEQLWLAEEGPFTTVESRTQWGHLDGSETSLIGATDALYRFFSRSGRGRLRELEVAVAKGEPWQETVADGLAEPDNGLIAVGQDIAFAAPLARRYGTVGRIITAVRESIAECLERAAAQTPLVPGSALATLHGTRFPIVQGPMTRVSDVGSFAKAVADGGALPFMALAVLRGPQVRAMLTRTKELIGDLPWGVGILGFIPLELRQQQLDIVREVKPPFAIIAGGRPSQARELEDVGITTYLHVPSPGLLRGFLADGARRFVFEGSECGGHTGPRTSFILWESAIEILTSADIKDPESVQVLFAGGIHDAMSAAMVSVLASPLVARGMKVGVLMGTAYLFTHEIVRAGAIVEEFQQQAVDCQETALLQSGIGIYTRCAQTPFCDEFEGVRRELVLASKSEDETLMALELMNIGRLRIAAKGIAHNSDPASQSGDDRYVNVDSETQRREGMYMLGEVARLRSRTCSIAELHASVSTGSEALLRHRKARSIQLPPRSRREDIAIVGMACLFPRAEGLRDYWQNILRGVDAIREVTDDRWSVADLFDPKRGTPDKVYSKWGGFVDDIQFDPQRYGIAPASLASIEPVQLLALEVARQALEDAGFDRRPFPREKTATIFAVGGMNDLGTIFNFRTLLPQYLAKVPDLPEQTRKHILDALFRDELPKWTEDTFPGILGNVVSGRVANRLDLGGANFTVDAACAASLAALDAGIRQLRNHDADVALVGGVDGTNSPIGYMCFAQTHALSPRGRSRPFDETADGIAISEGVGAVVLKRVSDAERDGDRIYAVIRGIGSSSDGRNRSLTAPHPPGQVTALKRAYADGDVDPATVTLIEAHGTGTALGDKSEIESLNLAFGEASLATQVCAVGSVKSMIGHTKVAAGLAGLIKAALALKHRVLPPTLGVDKPASGIDFARSPFYINTETRPWLHDGRNHPRHCGVSAFGFGGTNFHAVLAEYTGAYRDSDAVDLNPRDGEIFAFAGATRAEIESDVRRMLQGLEYAEQIDLAQLAYSLYREQHVVRRANGGQPCRLTLLAASVVDLKQKLLRVLELLPRHAEITQPPGIYYRETADKAGGVCFLFPGQGSQRINMLRDLAVALPALHERFADDRVRRGEDPSQPISCFIYPLPAFSDAEREAQQQALNATEIAQPALGMVEMAAFQVLTGYGLRPDFVAGHSYGEYVALCAAGAITYDDLLHLSRFRGRLSASAPPGAMAALDGDGEQVAAAIAQHGLEVSIANLNAPDQTIIAGKTEAIDAAVTCLSQASLRVKKLPVSAAFHCEIMAGARDTLAGELATVEFRSPTIPVYSNTTGRPYPQTSDEVRALLAKHIAEPVRFRDEIDALYEAGARVFIECGPGLVLGGLVDRILADRTHTTLAIDAPGRPGWLQLAQLLTQAVAIGLPVRLDTWFAGRGLVECSPEEVFAEAGKRAAPGPLVWRVNAARAQPWHGPQRKAAQPRKAPGVTEIAAPVVEAHPSRTAESPVEAPRPTLIATRHLESPSISDRRNAMKADTVSSDGPMATGAGPQPAGARCSESEFAQIQYGVGRLLDLQCEQQQSLRHFLDFQAQLIGVQLLHSPQHVGQPMAIPVQVSAANLAPPPRAQAEAVPSVAPMILSAAPPTPVLPKQLVASSTSVPTPEFAGSIEAPEPVAAPLESGPAATRSNGSQPPSHASAAEFKADLLSTVSERTGYPADMLDLDAHMEADLGIDSIKRIEIFSGLTSKYNLLGERNEEAVIEELSGLKTLNEVMGWYEQLLGGAVAAELGVMSPKKAQTPLSTFNETVESKIDTTQTDPVQCYTVQPIAAHFDDGVGVTDFPAGYPILLIGDETPLGNAFKSALRRGGHSVRQLIPGKATRVLDEGRYEVDFSSLESVQQLRELLAGSAEPVGTLINLMGASGDSDARGHHQQDGRALFLLLKVFEKDLKNSAQGGAGWIVNVTSFDGQFGLSQSRAFAAESAGILGVAKSVAREWSTVRVKCIDVAPGLEPDWLAAQVLAEMRSGQPGIEVGYTGQGRWRLDLKNHDVLRQDLSRLTLDPDAVVLVTGGAYGITADVTRALAEKYRPRLIVVGRSALPEDEAETIFDIEDPAELKQFLIRDMRARHGKVTPAEVDRALKRVIRDREIRANLAAMRATGAQVEYHSLDVRDRVAFGNLIDDVYARCGRIDGVLHGAGVISDKLIADKSVESFDAVFDTKVTPALVLESKLRPSSLKFIVFFSSVTGRFGNVGQCDYSAANEVLNKLANRLCHTWPHVHAVSINWGPWDAGMVSDELRKLYAARSIRPIPAELGRRHFLDELERGASGKPELVISSSIQQIATLRLGHEKGASIK
ncbi:acyl transferase domain-containing protein/NAD(P)H-dependent flavin oxidoreductase YrpB (nitropropane dioxygenase family)/NAD(P)-dependent dehydrogenase (short-subunit alcohol dehydrogenase family)/acyl carrier protein [Paraburkholderia sp. GAS348]